MNNVEFDLINQYLNKVSNFLPYPKSMKEDALDELRIDVQAAIKDSDGGSPSTVFGNPRDVALNISQAQNWHKERATWRTRFVAWVIDLIILTSVMVIYLGSAFLLFISFLMPYDQLVQELSEWESSTYLSAIFSLEGLIILTYMIFLSITSLIFFLGYHIFLERKYGATLGKKCFKLIVVDPSGLRITWKQAMIRNLSKIIVSDQFLPFDLALGLILEKLSPEKAKKQRGLDILAETIVIKQKSKKGVV